MDSIQAMGTILTARWAFNGKLLRARIVPPRIGNDGVSWFTIAIAVMTFVQTMLPGMLNQSQVRQLAVAMIVFIFLFLLLMITIPATTIPHYYGDTGAWCWIIDTRGEASRLRIGSEYAYFWLAATVSFVLYGTIVVNWLREATATRDRRRHRRGTIYGMVSNSLHCGGIPNIPRSISAMEAEGPYAPAWVYPPCSHYHRVLGCGQCPPVAPHRPPIWFFRFPGGR
ncbi:hypothetical protein BS47DRAFT_882419 [Hydnum rufescens UP504]|uniref:Glucose receptor Git3 N-terminal domain-containing protein n=1 Tax=Hydnum rufescens UP504 TaxID=1448309 RepID=A0A9P6DX53_9AGAM|nr:hypothetical protein BS47DRAFT_882419 [Hydnum rufescens UP504]